jgi:hypothetical protein
VTHQIEFAVFAVALGLGLFAAMLVCLEVGRRLALHQTEKHGTAARTGVGKADAPVYTILALLIGFTFSGATTRFDYRRELVSREANAISTAWLRIAMLPQASQPAIRDRFRRYVDVRLASYSSALTPAEAVREPPAVARARDTLWMDAVAGCRADRGDRTCLLLLPALNEMFDLADMERLARWIHPPVIIYVMLGIAALASALFAGYALAAAARNPMYMVAIAATVAVALYVIVELEYPRRGLVRVDAMDKVLVELRATLR